MKIKSLLFVMLMFLASFSFAQPFENQGAGVTMIIHGWNPDGSEPAWMQEMANAIIDRNGGNGQVATITVTGTNGNLTATCSDWTFDMVNATSGEIVVLVNWTAVSNHLTTYVSAQQVAAAVAPKIYQSQNGQQPLSELPLHFIGHSRGGGMVFEIARLLGLQGIEVEQVTALDPHPLTEADPQPITGPHTTDTPVKIYENVLFVDNYYQNIEFPTGQYVTGAFNRLWTSLPGGYHNETGYTYNILGTNYDFSDHLNIILMYHGTIDLATPASNGQATMTQTERDAWFNTYETQGEIEGFYYSLDVRGNRKSMDAPVSGGDQVIDGYHNNALLGGDGTRQAQTWTNAVFPNILTLDILQNSIVLPVGLQSLNMGEEIQFQYNYRSYANASVVTIYADIDRNPYNSNSQAIGTENLSATSSSIMQSSVNWTITGLDTGTKYYFYAKIDDGTHVRFIYSLHEFDVHILNDLSVVNIIKPVKNFNSNTPLTISIANMGENSQSNFPVSYTLNGNTLSETCSQTIASGDTLDFVFSQGIDLSTDAIYNISAKTDLANDENTSNDEFSTKINTYTNDNAIFSLYSDYIQIPDNDGFNFTDDFTIEAWFYSNTTKKGNEDIISKHANDGTNRSGYTIEYDGTNVKAIIGAGANWITATLPASLNQWHHVVMIYNNSEVTLIVDGVASSPVSGVMLQNTKDLYICGSQQYGNFLTGFVDEVRIWNIARTTTEIQDNMNTEIDPQTSGLVAYYQFNQGISQGDNTDIEYLADMTDNNYHGKLNNFALTSGNPDHNFFSTCNLDLAAPETPTLSDLTGECSVTATAPITTDNCAGTVTGTTTDPTEYTEQGTYTITWMFADGNGHSIEVEQTVIVDDITASIPDVATLPDITAVCEVTTLTAPTATDNCSGSITGTHNATLPITSQGTTIVTWSYDDGNGNISTQTQNVIINDVTDPTISCVENQTINLNEGETFYTVQGTEFDPTSTDDNCDIASVENDFNNTATLANAQLPEGTTTIVWAVTDNSGNTVNCSFDVTVNAYVGVETLQQYGISIYPNPTNGIINFELSNNNIQKVAISDITGKRIIEIITLNNIEQIDLSGFESGIYIISIQTDKEIFTNKLIKN